MLFEWDEAKSNRNLKERGLDFENAAMIFDSPVHIALDDRKDYGEDRFIALGAVDDVVLVVVYTDRGEVRRIISARHANRKERELWHFFVSL